MQNRNIKSKTMDETNARIQDRIANKERREQNTNRLGEMIKHLKSVHDLMEMRDALHIKIDTYDVHNLSYDLEDHRRDCKILIYLEDRIKDKQRIKKNYQYALQSD